LEMCENITELRQKQKKECESDLVSLLAAAFRQRARIEAEQSGWTGTMQEGQGEVQDRLEVFVRDVKNKDSVNGGADDEVHERLKELLEKALAAASSVEDSSSDDKKYFPEMEDDLYMMKFQLREHMHKVRFAAKELCGRMRALRFFHCVRKFQAAEEKLSCPGFKSEHCLCSSKGEALTHDKVGVFSCCGHTGCIKCLNYHADHEHCIDPTCKAAVKITHIATAAQLGMDKSDSNVGCYGAKLSAVVKQVKQLVEGGDRVICFVQFEDLKMKVQEALKENEVLALIVKGTVQQKAAALDVMQKETPEKGDPRVLILTMDDESSAGINLTTCNHAVFVHPLLADTQQQYEAYETQSIGRIRRYGQTKTVHIWRYLVRDSIDTEIFQKRTGE
jgi:SNF2 family DNA or RNA helicase